MKKFIVLVALLSGVFSLYAQVPDLFSYQAIVRDVNGDPVRNSRIGVQISILKDSAGGSLVYRETHNPTTDNNGWFVVNVGGGQPSQSVFSAIQWGTAPMFIRSGIDPQGGTNYNITGVTQLLSVPYALYARKANGLTDPAKDGDTSAVNELQSLSLHGDTLFLTGTGYVVLPIKPDQQLSIQGDSIYLSKWWCDPPSKWWRCDTTDHPTGRYPCTFRWRRTGSDTETAAGGSSGTSSP